MHTIIPTFICMDTCGKREITIGTHTDTHIQYTLKRRIYGACKKYLFDMILYKYAQIHPTLDLYINLKQNYAW